MAGKSTTYSTALLAGLRTRPTPALAQFVATSYLALLSANPTDNTIVGAGESPYTGYTAATSRQGIVSSTSGWNAPSGTNAVTMTNAALLTFPTATGAGSITGVALCGDNTTIITTAGSLTGAGTAYWNTITTQTVNNTNPVTVAAGAVTVSET